MKRFFLISLSALTFSAFGGTKDDAYKKVCAPMVFQNDKEQCISKIRNYNYFDDRILDICAEFSFTNEKLTCLSYIGNKKYADYEFDHCNSIQFNSQKLSCLNTNGSNWTGDICVDKQQLVQNLNQIKMNIATGNYLQAHELVNSSINSLNSCSQ